MSQTELDRATPEWSGYAVHNQPHLTQAQAAQQLKLGIAGKSLTRAYVAVVLLDLPPSGAAGRIGAGLSTQRRGLMASP